MAYVPGLVSPIAEALTKNSALSKYYYYCMSNIRTWQYVLPEKRYLLSLFRIENFGYFYFVEPELFKLYEYT